MEVIFPVQHWTKCFCRALNWLVSTDMPYVASQKCKLFNIFLFKFSASSSYCSQKPAENHKFFDQALNQTTFYDQALNQIKFYDQAPNQTKFYDQALNQTKFYDQALNQTTFARIPWARNATFTTLCHQGSVVIQKQSRKNHIIRNKSCNNFVYT